MDNKLKHWINDLGERARRALSVKNIIVAIFIILFTLLITASLTFLTIKLITYIASNFEFLLISVGGMIMVVTWIKEHYKDKRKRSIDISHSEKQQADEIELARAEEIYILIRQCLIMVNNEMVGVTRLHKIGSPSEIDTPHHFIKANGGFFIYQYLIAKESEEIDVTNLKVILSKRMEQRILAQEFSGIAQTIYVHTSGRTYPIICIEELEDHNAYIQISIAWGGKAYCEYHENKETIKKQLYQDRSAINRDKDF